MTSYPSFICQNGVHIENFIQSAVPPLSFLGAPETSCHGSHPADSGTAHNMPYAMINSSTQPIMTENTCRVVTAVSKSVRGDDEQLSRYCPPKPIIPSSSPNSARRRSATGSTTSTEPSTRNRTVTPRNLLAPNKLLPDGCRSWFPTYWNSRSVGLAQNDDSEIRDTIVSAQQVCTSQTISQLTSPFEGNCITATFPPMTSEQQDVKKHFPVGLSSGKTHTSSTPTSHSYLVPCANMPVHHQHFPLVTTSSINLNLPTTSIADDHQASLRHPASTYTDAQSQFIYPPANYATFPRQAKLHTSWQSCDVRFSTQELPNIAAAAAAAAAFRGLDPAVATAQMLRISSLANKLRTKSRTMSVNQSEDRYQLRELPHHTYNAVAKKPARGFRMQRLRTLLQTTSLSAAMVAAMAAEYLNVSSNATEINNFLGSVSPYTTGSMKPVYASVDETLQQMEPQMHDNIEQTESRDFWCNSHLTGPAARDLGTVTAKQQNPFHYPTNLATHLDPTDAFGQRKISPSQCLELIR
ncbi:hypothetical protein EG68_04882 [Paragonimus skrjabini miyazakii]|uniref:Uncharacterized protein n=1 Tax=Paragonimus skrjabini miyazakii TaxID=59628 RepID=A0A8S9YS78_9TREM|nr:hypothetical protein EG68_04882 [Paragonimus skrjabini miyazakii]